LAPQGHRDLRGDSDGLSYLGSGLHPFASGICGPQLALVAGLSRPFTLLGGVMRLKIWHELPAATRKYIAEVEAKKHADCQTT